MNDLPQDKTLLDKQCDWLKWLLRTRLYGDRMGYYEAREFAHDAAKAFRREFEQPTAQHADGDNRPT